MTQEEATIVVEDHIRWLEGPGDRQTVADALKWLFFHMGVRSVNEINALKRLQGTKNEIKKL